MISHQDSTGRRLVTAVARHLSCGDVILSPRGDRLQIACESGCTPIDIDGINVLLLDDNTEVSNDDTTARTG